jgi:hypothetical protein
MLEHVRDPLLSRAAFAGRVLRWFLFTVLLIALSLAGGVCGYHYLEGLSRLDSLLNAAMILGGMGPVDALHTPAGKLFAAGYAIYCGLFLLICGGLLLVPVFHRVLHRLHAEDDDDDDSLAP